MGFYDPGQEAALEGTRCILEALEASDCMDANVALPAHEVEWMLDLIERGATCHRAAHEALAELHKLEAAVTTLANQPGTPLALAAILRSMIKP